MKAVGRTLIFNSNGKASNRKKGILTGTTSALWGITVSFDYNMAEIRFPAIRLFFQTACYINAGSMSNLYSK
ncbi:hypothetical protein [Neisseria dumasiana]|uniref:Uncharacterized protein n=1 Tax=Neisseria dumasiana TaxID=1931275 RepID=A0ABX3WNP4_9NEIS|nr:hypothetical protein [Neisseria dumasiana]OSI35804.1 hypothetical protein BV913_03970 [Neisseria dumasiana]